MMEIILNPITSIFIAITIIAVKTIFYDSKIQRENFLLNSELKIKESDLESLKEQIITKESENKQLLHNKYNLEKELELIKQKFLLHEEQLATWKSDHERYLELTKASILKAGSEMSSKLLDDHKRENENIRKEQERKFTETSTKLNEQFENICKSMHTLNDKISKVEIIERALLAPQGVGMLSEITLENIFKSSGLIENQDYILQYWAESSENGGYKPDAVVFLPNNQIIVVDSKASKFFMELECFDNDNENKKKLELSLKQTMNQHLKSLIERNYTQAVNDHLKKTKPIDGSYQVVTLMFLPTEVVLDKFRKIDRQFEEKAWRNNIILVGPSGLVNALLQARQSIAIAKQNKHYDLIIDEVKKLLTSVSTLYASSESLGKSIKSVVEKYDKFAGSFNSNFISKVKRLGQYGIAISKKEDISRLERYQLIQSSKLIDSEAVDQSNDKLYEQDEA